MYPRHTGSVLLDIAHAQRRELIRDAESRRRARSTKTSPPQHHHFGSWRPRWWGFAHSRHAA